MCMFQIKEKLLKDFSPISFIFVNQYKSFIHFFIMLKVTFKVIYGHFLVDVIFILAMHGGDCVQVVTISNGNAREIFGKFIFYLCAYISLY